MFSAKQGNYWYHFYNVFGMTRYSIDLGKRRNVMNTLMLFVLNELNLEFSLLKMLYANNAPF